jgi:hypothetical protein
MKIAIACILLLLTSQVYGANEMITWPSLSEYRGVSGRPAKADDVASGSAIFVLQDSGTPIGRSIDIVVPQYGFHIDEDGVKRQCIVIQAEEARGKRLIGAYRLPEREMFAGFYDEFELLGTSPPH